MHERAVVLVLVLESQSDYGLQWEAIVSVVEKVGVSGERLCRWVRHAEMDAGRRVGTTSVDAESLRKLRRENRDLRRANEILKAAATFFARELDPRGPRSQGSSRSIRKGLESIRSAPC